MEAKIKNNWRKVVYFVAVISGLHKELFLMLFVSYLQMTN